MGKNTVLRSYRRLSLTAALATQLPALTATAQQLTAAEVKALPTCSLGITNGRCKLVIDRANPIAPPVVQMYSDQQITVVIKNRKTFERYFLDYQSGQGTVTPDVASSIVQGLLPSLAKVNGLIREELYFIPPPQGAPPEDPCAVPALTSDPLPTANHVADVVPAFQKCLAKLAADAIGIYRGLEPVLAPDSRTPNGSLAEPDLDAVQSVISDFVGTEVAVSSRITNISNIDKIKITDGPAVLVLGNLQKVADGVASDLSGYSLRITDYWSFDNGFENCKEALGDKAEGDCLWITSATDDHHAYRNMVTRTITYSLNTLNLISNSQQAAPDPSKKKLLATIGINFADSRRRSVGSAFRWEASAGAFFSSLAVRSFSAAPVFTGDTVTDKKIAQNALYPTVVPFATANYRLTNDLGWSRWKSNVYWTGAVGINPNTVSTDFVTGLSLSWRALMVSGLCHFGHDVRLIPGLKPGDSLGASFSGSLPTANYWTESAALGVSIRVPSLTGR